MPLDGSTLTLRWMRAPARGLAVASLYRRLPPLSRSLGVEKKKASGRERRMS
jgi:hypothetical protein